MKKELSILLFTLCFVGAGCRKDATIDMTVRSNIFVCGYIAPETIFYSKNNEIHYPGLTWSSLNGFLFAYRNDIYFPINNGYLKNGIKVTLDDANAIYDVFVTNESVYASGIKKSNGAPAYWKNGKVTEMELPPDTFNLYPVYIAVSGTDVYVSGSVKSSPTSERKVIYWKNGVMNILEDGDIQGMSVSGSNVCIAANVKEGGQTIGFYWKNGVKHIPYTPQGTNVTVGSIYADGDDVYVSAISQNVLYWKNNIPFVMKHESYVFGVVIDNKNVYVAENFYSLTTLLPIAHRVSLLKDNKLTEVMAGPGGCWQISKAVTIPGE